MLMHRRQTPQPGFGSITLLQKFTPHFKILDPRLEECQRDEIESQTFAPMEDLRTAGAYIYVNFTFGTTQHVVIRAIRFKFTD